jgi:release factor glutamine methyltransferase
VGRGQVTGSMTPEEAPGRGDQRRRAVASIAEQLGSRQEAVWIVDHAGVDLAPALAERRRAGEPLQYVLGRWPFRSIELAVDPRVLIPRPETEQVVGVALRELERVPSGSEDRTVCVDLGTGSGAIALSLAVEGASARPGLEIWATDASADALEVARANLADLGRTDPAAAGRVRLAEGRWFQALPASLAGQVDLLVSNPPYVTESEYPALDPTVRLWEPKEALVAGSDDAGVPGMAAIAAIISGAPRWLAPHGAMVMEIAPSLAGPGLAAARKAGFGSVSAERDLAGRLRTLVARW